MKKQIKYLFLLTFLFITVISCKKDDNGGTPDPFKSAYTKEDPDVSKANVEDEGIAFIDEMNDMKDANAFEVLINFSSLSSTDPILKSSKVLNPLRIGPDANAKSIVNTLKSAAADPTSLTEAWDQIVGTYEWDIVADSFVYTEGGNKIIILFPGKETDDENTATITVSNFTVVELTDTSLYGYPIEGWDPELPTKLHIALEYNGDLLASYDISAAYTDNGLPTNVTSKLTIEDFVFTVTANHSPYSKASFTSNLKRGSNLLAEIYIAANGDWSEENRNENEEENFEEIINNANAHFILMNIKVAGKVDILNLAPALTDIDAEYVDEYGDLIDPNDAENYSDAIVDAINENAQLVVVYTDSNKKIAEAEAYTYYDEVYDEYYPSMRFVYADDSKEDVAEFAKDNLDNFYDELNNFIDDLNAEYDLGLDPVEPPAK